MKINSLFRYTSLSIIILWLALLTFVPLLLVTITSFLSSNDTRLLIFDVTFKNYGTLTQFLYYRVLEQSLLLALCVTCICLLIGYPSAYFISQLTRRNKALALLFVVLPFWTSSLIRSYAILAILKTKGLLNTLLLSLGIIDQPLQLLYTNYAVLIGCVYNLLPFMILPLYASIDKLDPHLLEAARDLGAKRITLLTRIMLPLTLPGIIAGSLLVFLPAMTLFYIPVLLGGSKSLFIGNLIQMQFLTMRNWPGGAATSMVLTLFMLLLITLYRHYTKGIQRQELLV